MKKPAGKTAAAKRTSVPQGAGPLTWSRFDGGKSERAFMTCKCGYTAELEEIAADGTVTPSVECPHCDFDERVVLAGWTPPAPKKMRSAKGAR